VRVVGIYAAGSTVNRLAGITTPIITSTNHSYFAHGSLGRTGYNYLGDHNIFEKLSIGISQLAFKGGVIEFENGIKGVIKTTYGGTPSNKEQSYIYYNAGDRVTIGLNYDT